MSGHPRVSACAVVCWTALLLVLTASAARAQPPRHELAPTGRLRVAVGVGAANSAFWASRDGNGRPQGITVDLADALATRLGVPLELVVYSNSGDVTDAGPRGEWDVTFLPQDAERERLVDFGAAYVLSESTYLVPAGSPIARFEEVDRLGVTVVGVGNTATGRSAERALTRARFVAYRTQEELLRELEAGRAQAIALSREALGSLLPRLPGARMLEGSFHQAAMAAAVPKGHAAARAYVSAFVEDAKASGLVRRALDRAGLRDAVVAPAGR